MAKQSKDGYFRSTFYFDNKQYVCTGKTEKEAEKKATLRLDKLKRGEVGISSNMTVNRWAEEWLRTYRKPNNTRKSYENIEARVNNRILPEIGGLKLTDVKDIHLQSILNNLVGFSNDYIYKVKSLLQGMFKQARVSRLIVYDPAEALKSPKGTEGIPRRAITDFERAHILKVSETNDYGVLIKTLLYTGIRPGELRALTWNHIDLDRQYIYIRQAVESGSENIKEPKSKAGIRDIPIVDLLSPGLKNAKKEALRNGSSPLDYVFLQIKGKKRHSESTFRGLWKTFIKQVDISMGAVYEKKEAKDGKMRMALKLSIIDKRLDAYHLRHTYGTDLQRAGVPINVAKYLMGHSDIKVTSAIYTHTTDDVLEQARILQNSNGNERNNEKEKSKANHCYNQGIQ